MDTDGGSQVKKETLAGLVRNFREGRGLTQKDLAQAINYSKAQISKIESGQTPYTTRLGQAMRQAFGDDWYREAQGLKPGDPIRLMPENELDLDRIRKTPDYHFYESSLVRILHEGDERKKYAVMVILSACDPDTKAVFDREPDYPTPELAKYFRGLKKKSGHTLHDDPGEYPDPDKEK